MTCLLVADIANELERVAQDEKTQAAAIHVEEPKKEKREAN